MNPGSIAMLAAMLAGTVMAADAPPQGYKPSAAQIALAGQLRMPPQPPGRNAYPLLWSFGFDLSTTQVDAAYKADRAIALRWTDGAHAEHERTGAWPRFPYAAATVGKPSRSVPDGDYALLCGLAVSSCLDQVRARREAIRAVLVRNAVLLARVQSLAGYDTWWNTMPADSMLPVAGALPALKFWASAAALRFVDGDAVGGLDMACTAAATFRRLHAHANTVLDTAFTETGARSQVHLAAEMMAALPEGAQVPDACQVAMAPVVAADVDYRGAAAFEWAFAVRSNEVGGHPDDAFAVLGYIVALGGVPGQKAMLDDTAVPTVDPASVTFDQNYADLLSGRIARGADYIATLRMGALALWLQAHPSHDPLERRLATAPVGALAKRLTVACAGHCLRMEHRSEGFASGRTWPIATP
ncbi:hypothetical protein KPL74_03280 [Bacillus sp. NP157]|nr:hypothetical protein KPL74_03280 [Bacillus sp. NP157]